MLIQNRDSPEQMLKINFHKNVRVCGDGVSVKKCVISRARFA
jgi:hypothetical protein